MNRHRAPQDAFVRAEFLERYLSDEEAGNRQRLEAYQRLFPGHEELIADEYAALQTGGAAPPPPLAAPPPMIAPGTSLGHYALERELGHGGQGVVYQALDTRLGRRVALKVLTGSVSTATDMLHRFRREAMVASRLDHPGICTVYESGESHGVAYIAMRLVEGETLAERIAARRRAAGSVDETPTDRPTTQRKEELRGILRVFERAARALHAAHDAGVIHRDIKPGNIMLTPEDQPVLMDFGLARELEGGLRTLTRTGEFFGTPAYMAPEQLDSGDDRPDQRLDIWALGVCLYESLALRGPFEAPTREGLYRAILTEEPARLRRFRGDVTAELEVILDTSLAKDPDRRYQTALDLAEDLRRYQDDEPISARPPSAAYRLRKFVRRNAILVGTMALVGVVLVLGIIGTSIGLAREAAALEKERDQRKIAQDEAARTAATLGFLKEMLRLAGPKHTAELERRGPVTERELTVRELLDVASATVEERFAKQPLIEASLQETLADLWLDVGKLENSEAHAERARDLYLEHRGKEHPATLSAANYLALLHQMQGRYEDAERLLLETLELSGRTLGEEDPVTLRVKRNLAMLRIAQDRFGEAESLLREVLEAAGRLLGEEHDNTITVMEDLGGLYNMQGRFEESDPLLQKALEISRRVRGATHPGTLKAMMEVAISHLTQSRYAEAEKLYETLLEIQKRILGEEHPYTLSTMGNFAHLRYEQGRREEAERLWDKTLKIQRRVFTEDNPALETTINNLASVYLGTDQLGKAEPLLEESLEIRRRRHGEDHTATANAMHNLGLLYLRTGRLEKAEDLLVKSLAIARRFYDDSHPTTLAYLNDLGAFWCMKDRPDEAEPLLREAARIAKQHLGVDHFTTAKILTRYGKCLGILEQFASAEDALLEAHRTFEKKGGAEHEWTIDVVQALAVLYEKWDKPEKAAEYRSLLQAASAEKDK